MNDKTYKVKSSAVRAAKKALGHDNFEIIEVPDGFVYNDLTATVAIGDEPQQDPVPDENQDGANEPESSDGPPAEILQAGDNAANGLVVTEAPPADPKAPLNVKRRSDIEKPTKAVWRLAESKLADQPGIRRKDMIDYLVGQGIAYYTARTQYQLYLAAVKTQNSATPATAATE